MRKIVNIRTGQRRDAAAVDASAPPAPPAAVTVEELAAALKATGAITDTDLSSAKRTLEAAAGEGEK